MMLDNKLMQGTVFKKYSSWLVLYVLIGVFLYLPFFIFSLEIMDDQLSRGIETRLAYPIYEKDQIGYVDIADNIINHRTFSEKLSPPFEIGTFRTPGLPSILVLWKLLFGSYVAFPILQIIFTILAAFLVFRIGNKLYHPYVGGIAGLFFLIDPNTILHALIIQTDIWNACLTVFLVYLFVVPSSLHSKAGMFSLGLLVGFSTLVRPISMYLIALFSAFYCFFERGSHAKKILVNLSLLLIGFSIILLPWVIRNKVQTGVAGISSVKDYNFFHYYLPSYMAYKQGISEADAKKILTSELRPVSLEQTDQLKYSPNVNEVWMRHFKEDPLGYAGLHFIKTIPVFLSSGTKTFFEAYGNMIGEPVLIFSRANMTDLLIHLDITALFREVVKNPLVMAEEIGLALICLFAFLAIFFKRNRPYTILLLCIIIYFAFLTGTVAYSRFRLPIAPFLFLLASCSIREFWIVYKNRYMSTR